MAQWPPKYATAFLTFKFIPQEMNGHIKQRLVVLFYTQIHRLLQLLCIQEMNRHDEQCLVEFYIIKILKNMINFCQP